MVRFLLEMENNNNNNNNNNTYQQKGQENLSYNYENYSSVD